MPLLPYCNEEANHTQQGMEDHAPDKVNTSEAFVVSVALTLTRKKELFRPSRSINRRADCLIFTEKAEDGIRVLIALAYLT